MDIQDGVAVYLITNCFNITMAIFDVAQHVISNAGGIIGSSTAIDDSALASMRTTLETMDLGPLIGVYFQSLIVQLTIRALGVVIFVIVYGRMIEIYLMVSLAPIPFSTFGNREQSQIGQNYFKSLLAVGFQGFLIMICVATVVMVIAMPTYAEAASRTCAVSGCDRKCDSGSYCRLHKCAESGCNSQKGDNGTIYCNTHAAKHARKTGYKVCSASGCYGRASGSGSYCYEHTCIKSGCDSKRASGSNYCSAHTPAKKSTTTKSSKSYSSTSTKSKKTYHDSYDDDYDWDRYWKDDDYARGVDDAMEDCYDDFGDDW